jgi:hypothetical protein
MEKQNKDLGYYGTGLGFLTICILLFFEMASGLRTNFGELWYFLFVFVVALSLLLFNKEKT